MRILKKGISRDETAHDVEQGCPGSSYDHVVQESKGDQGIQSSFSVRSGSANSGKDHHEDELEDAAPNKLFSVSGV